MRRMKICFVILSFLSYQENNNQELCSWMKYKALAENNLRRIKVYDEKYFQRSNAVVRQERSS